MGYWSMQFGWGVEKKVSRYIEVAQKGMLKDPSAVCALLIDSAFFLCAILIVTSVKLEN
jgi:hypothetical protein